MSPLVWVAGALALIPVLAVAAPYGAGAPVRGGAELRRLLARVEELGALPGILTFGLAAALRESGFNPEAFNPRDGPAAARLLKGALERGFYRQNPTLGDLAWTAGSGGWFGLLPASGLSAGGPDGPYARASPRLIHAPVPSVVMFCDLVARLIRRLPKIPEAARNWLAVRRGMATTELLYDWREEEKRSRDVRERLVSDLGRCCGLTESEAERFASERPQLGRYAGPSWLLARLEGAPTA